MISRYALADYFLQNCTDIIEIGGIGDYTNSSSFNSVVICDPLCTLESTSNVTYVKTSYMEVDWDKYLQKNGAIIGLRMMGIDLNMTNETVVVMKGIIKRMRMVAVEGPIDHPPSMDDLRVIMSLCKDVVADFEIDYGRSISKIDGREEMLKENKNTFLQRRMVILENQPLKTAKLSDNFIQINKGL